MSLELVDIQDDLVFHLREETQERLYWQSILWESLARYGYFDWILFIVYKRKKKVEKVW
jgi:hypothetical protein